VTDHELEEKKRFIYLRAIEDLSLGEISKKLRIPEEKLFQWNIDYNDEVIKMIQKKAALERKMEKEELSRLEKELDSLDFSKHDE
jgi:hypothetical protein